jgi:asparagine synthase (glutamine-hydrolysing)
VCGICGSTRDPDGAAVEAMNRVLRHRGPDDEGRYLDPEAGLALGARRLSIIDVEGGHQPLSNEDGSVWAALNGEIYNHPALREQLLERGHDLRSRTDTEVLVHLYEELGDELVDALEGMYAFAIWDRRRRRLLLVRDRFGEKPLFYTANGGELSFASELTALRAAGAVGDELDPAGVDAFFVFGYVPGPRTILRGVRLLPPGHFLVWEGGGERVGSYWSPPGPAAGAPAGGELLEEIRAALERSVRSRMISDVPLGVFLSGGVDSTVIAALAARNSSNRIKTFTVGYDVGEVNETTPARRTAELLEAEHHELVLGESDVTARVPDLLRRLDQPIADQALVALNAVAGLARREVTVAVGGEGADELFAGYPRYQWFERAERLGGVVPSALAAGLARRLRGADFRGRLRRLADVLEPQTALERHLDWVTERRRHLRESLYGPALRSAVDPRAVVEELSLLLDQQNGAITDRFMRLDQRHWLPDDVLAKADRSTMLVSLEMRTPYLHPELAELAAGVPGQKHTTGGDKALLRSAFSDLAPLKHRDRPKTAFRVPVSHWLRGPLKGALGEQLDRGALVEEGWFDRGPLATMVEAHQAGEADWTRVLWPVLALGLWLDAFRAGGSGVDS